MDLYELGKQYLEISKELRIKIADLNENSKKLKGNELIYMKRRIYSLYADALSCRRIAEKLMNYYK